MCVDDELAELGPIDFLNAGKTIPEIAEITGHVTKTLIILLKDALVEKTKNYLIQGKKVSEIALILGVGESTVKLWIKTFDLRQYWVSIRNKPEDKVDKSKIYSSYIKLNGIVELSSFFHMHHQTIKEFVTEAGFDIFRASTLLKAIGALNGENFRQINSETQEMMDGMMLGDAHIEVILKTVAPQISEIPSFKDLEKAINDLKYLQTTTDQDWSKLANMYNKAMKTIEAVPTARFDLGKALPEENWVDKVKERLTKDNYPAHVTKTDKIQLTTKSTFQMYQQHQRWYPDGKKIVPRDLKMTSNVALGWYVDDGFLSKYQIGLATDSFIKEDQKFLASQLFKEAKIETHIYAHKDSRYPDKIYYALYISKEENIKKFFSYLEKADKDLLDVAKKTFPWKFDRNLKKKDVTHE